MTGYQYGRTRPTALVPTPLDPDIMRARRHLTLIQAAIKAATLHHKRTQQARAAHQRTLHPGNGDMGPEAFRAEVQKIIDWCNTHYPESDLVKARRLREATNDAATSPAYVRRTA